VCFSLLLIQSVHYFWTDTACIPVCRAGSMWRSGVRLVCPPVPSFARRCCGFAAGCSVGTRCRSIAARPALSSKRGQCHVISRRRKLNTVLLLLCCELYKCSEWLEVMAPADFGSGFGDTAVTNTRFFTQGRHLSGKPGNLTAVWEISGKESRQQCYLHCLRTLYSQL